MQILPQQHANIRAGIYAVIDLAGDAVEATTRLPATDRSAHPSLMLCGVDRLDPAAVSVSVDASRCTILLGMLGDPHAVAAAVGVSPGAAPAALARAALDRFGDDTPRMMGGEWGLVDWTPAGTVLMAGSANRDPLLYARNGRRLAIAPDLEWLVGLPWVGREVDPVATMLILGTAAVRRHLNDRTVATGVRRVRAGDVVRLDRDGARTVRCDLAAHPARFRGSFEDAMAQADAVLRRIAAEAVARAPGMACLLSGGLDSSLSTVLMADAHRDLGRDVGRDRPFACLTTSGPPNSMLPDEMAIAGQVAGPLGLPHHAVWAPDAASPYRPSVSHMLASNAPSVALRAYLYDELLAAGEERGMPVIVDGNHGELNVTAFGPEDLQRRRWWHGLRSRLRAGSAGPDQPGYQTHVRLAPHRAAELRHALHAMPVLPDQETPSHGDLWGYTAGTANAREALTDMRQGRSRVLLPFRDHRLLDLFASFPIAFAQRDGLQRAPARHLLAGRVPDTVRLRQRGLPFAPDYHQRLRQQAPAALARLPEFRRAGLQDWFDLDWLDRGLRRLAAGRRVPLDLNIQVQATAMVAEYLLWWQSN